MTAPGVRAALAILTLSAAVPGAWATASPASFHADFPGLGLTWVAPLGPDDEHLVRDVGGFHLALAALSAYAAKERVVAR